MKREIKNTIQNVFFNLFDARTRAQEMADILGCDVHITKEEDGTFTMFGHGDRVERIRPTTFENQ